MEQCVQHAELCKLFLENGLTDQVQYNRTDPEVDKQIKLRLEGESYFLRAWWHFELLKMYGGKAKNGKALGIPLADHFISQDEAAQNGEFLRPTYQATVDFIVNDLDNAIELLPNVYQEMTWSLVIHKSVVPRKRRQLF